jgi:2-keto-3-deoxy-L-rhamnonate aldolase RhmA
MYSERGLFIDGAWRRTGEAAEIMASAGYDSITADLQHGAFDYQAALAMFQAMRASGVAVMARVPWLDARAIMKRLAPAPTALSAR